MLTVTVGQIRDIAVMAGFRNVIPGGASIAGVVSFVINNNLESKLLPDEQNIDDRSLSEHIEKALQKAAANVNLKLDVPGVRTGDIAVFVKFANDKGLWQRYREVAVKG